MSGGVISSFDNDKGMHFGTNSNTCNSVSISTQNISGTITSVEVEASRGSSLVGTLAVSVGGSNFYNGTSTTNALTTSNTAYTFTGSASGLIDILWTKTSGKGAYYIKKITVTYSTEANLPSISAENVELAYDATQGSIEYTLTNGTDSGYLVAVPGTNGYSWLSIGGTYYTASTGSIPFTCTTNTAATARTAVITLTYSYNGGQASVTKDVMITQAGNPNAVDNISDITAAGTYAVQGTIVAKSSRGFIVGDGTGYVYYYNTNYTPADYNIGDIVKLSGSVVVYGGVFEFNNTTTVTAATSSNYQAEDPTVLSGADMDARVASTTPPQLSNYVQYEGTLTVDGTRYNITNITGASTAIGSISYPLVTDFTSLNGKQVKVTGYYVGISSNTYYNTMIGSVVEIITNDPSITASNVEIGYDVTESAIAYTINNAVADGVLTVETESDWLNFGEIGSTNIPIYCDPNTAATARTATVTLTYTYNTDQFVTLDILVTQAGNPNAVDNISDITAAGTYAVQGTIVAKSSRGFIVGDGTGYVYYYNTNYTPADYNIGDIVKLSGSVVVYGGVFEFNNTTTVTAATSSNYQAEDPTVLSGADMDARVASTTPPQLSNYVQYEGTLTVDGTRYNITNITGASTAIGSISYPLVTDFTSLNGKQVKVTGYYVGISSSTYYNTMIGSVEEVTSTEPSINVTPDVVNIPAEGYTEFEFTAISQNIEDFSDFDFCFTDSEGTPQTTTFPDWIPITEASIASPNFYFTIAPNDGAARTAYFKVFWSPNNGLDLVYSNMITINQAAAPSYAELPFEFDGGKADIENTDGLTQEGLGNDYSSSPKLRFDNTGDWLILQFNEAPGTLTFDIKGNSYSQGSTSTFSVQASEDGITYTDLTTYTELGATQSETFDNLDEDIRYIRWIYTEKGQTNGGNVALGNIHLYEVGGGPAPVASLSVTPTTLNLGATGTQIGSLTLTYENIEVTNYQSFFIQYYDAAGEEAEQPDWIVSGVTGTNNEGYVVNCVAIDNDGEARTAYFKVYAYDANNEQVFTELVTINQAAYTPPFTGTTFTLATAIESGRRYIISDGEGKAMGGQNNNNRAAIDITFDPNGGAHVSSADVVELVINGPDEAGNYTIYDATIPGYLYAASSSSNYLRTEEFLDENANGLWTIEFGPDGNAIITAQGNNERNVMRHNSTNDIFSCYAATSNQAAVYLYVKSEETPQYTFYKDIVGYGEDTNPGGYYLIASPVDDIDPEDVTGMTDGNFDLYWFDQSEELPWRNYEATNGHFNLASGQGYLYAHSTTVTLAFDGTPTDEYSVTLVKDNNAPDFPGLNLVGNPFGKVAYINKAFYVVNEDGSELEAREDNYINMMEGVFVEAGSNGETLTFNENPTGGSKLVMNVSGDRGTVIDRAIVRLDGNETLSKFQLNANSTKIYIPLDGNDYAVVSNEEAYAEMPVNFKAQSNGSYTLSFNLKNAEFSYLHLFDQMTGNDIDLLATPSYTFNAQTTDYAARFKVIFEKTTTGVSEHFAYVSDGNLILNGEGTVQVFDVTGRLISSHNDVNRISTEGLTPGVYMIRLINGNDVKTQKIIVK